jgi:hypothetical protein
MPIAPLAMKPPETRRGPVIESAPMTTPKRTKNPHAVALGRRGGIAAAGAGAAVRFAAMTPDERRKLAKKAAAARWSSKKGRRSV